MSQPAHAGQPASAPLLILVLNANGLRDPTKRRTLFSIFLQGPWHILLILEAHLASVEEAQRWVQDGAGAGIAWAALCGPA